MFDYKKKIEELRSSGGEFDHLNGKAFLDHAANAVYMRGLIHDYYLQLTQNLFSNPHSHSESGLYTQSYVNLTREKILSLFKASAGDYDCVFVSNASGGFKLLGEVFDFTASGCFAYLNDNHTSVVGLRELAWLKGCEVYCVYEGEDEQLRAELVKKDAARMKEDTGRNLFAYPAQSNFNSQRYPLDWVNAVQSNGIRGVEHHSSDWFVCLDAASFVCTSVLDLSKVKPDFVPVSFYKIFGFPTGLGALLIRKSDRVKNSIRKSYFSGGTVKMALISEAVFAFRDKNYHEFMEDGTVAYLDVIAVNLAIDKFSSLFNGNCFMSCIESYVHQLSDVCFRKLNELRHFNGVQLVELYRRQESGRQGPIFAFNLKDSSEKYISYILANKLAQESGIQLRVGCFCNIGACKMHLKKLNLLENYQVFGHNCGDHIDLINGLPTGAIRISLGYCSTEDDVEKLIQFLSEKFIDHKATVSPTDSTEPIDMPDRQYYKLVKLLIYPIKSCAPLEVDASWPLCSRTSSLQYDRHWIILDGNSIPLTQKRMPLLTNLHVSIDIGQNLLRLMYKDSSMQISLELSESERENLKVLSVCTHQINGVDCGDAVAVWLKKQFEADFDCRLIKLNLDDRSGCLNETGKSTFNNQADFLLISVNSVRKLRRYLLASFQMNITDERVLFNIDNQLISQFRANFVVEILNNGDNVNEEHWKVIEFNKNLKFDVTSLCTRCQMINISQLEDDDENSKRVFSQLLKELYRFKASSKFGVYLKRSRADGARSDTEMSVGMVGVAEVKRMNE